MRPDSERSHVSVVTTATRYVRTQPSSQSNLLRLQGLLRPVSLENAGPVGDPELGFETAENGGLPVEHQLVLHSNAPQR